MSIEYITLNIFLFILISIVSCIFHELGHYVSALYMNAEPKFGLMGYIPCIYYNNNSISKGNELMILVSGMITGFVPLVILSPFINVYLFIAVLVDIIIASISDIRHVWRIIDEI